MRMFKIGSFEQELAESMEENLNSSQVEKKFNFEKIEKAANFLHAAAELFDQTGFEVESEVITRLLERLANRSQEKEVIKEATVSLGDLTSEEMKFYQDLPRHTKDMLEKHIKKSGYHMDVTDFVKEVKLLHKMRRAKEPHMLEFESLMNPSPSNGSDDIIEFTSLDKKKL